jgi:hypothetical protein
VFQIETKNPSSYPEGAIEEDEGGSPKKSVRRSLSRGTPDEHSKG